MREEAAANSPVAPLPVSVWVGTMGWSYEDWKGPFYPPSAAARDYLGLYAQAFDAVEIDSTFYGTPRESQVKQWGAVTPDGFVFCPKVPRLITHDLRLVNAQEPLAEFVRVMGLLGEKRGPMLLQFPPDFTRAELSALQVFLPALHDLGDPTARFVVEFRHRSLIGPDVSALLQEHSVTLAATDYAPMPRRFEVTADFVYLRLIGRHGAFSRHNERQADRTPDLVRWTNTLRAQADRFAAAYVLCNDDYEGFAPKTAEAVRSLLGLPLPARPQEAQQSLF